MKKLIFLIAAILVSTGVFAGSEDDNALACKKPGQQGVVTLTADLSSSIKLNLPNTGITFKFSSIDDYQNGINKSEADDNYVMKGYVESTANWQLTAQASSDLIHTDNNSHLDIGNVGLVVDWKGKNNITNNTSSKNPKSITKGTPVVLVTKGSRTNAGNAQDNAFNLIWEMGTGQGELSKFDSIFNQDVKKGSFTTQVTISATEIL